MEVLSPRCGICKGRSKPCARWRTLDLYMHTGSVRAGALLWSRRAPCAMGSATWAPASPLPVSQLSCLALQAVINKHSFAKANRGQPGLCPHCPSFHTWLRAWEPYKCPLVPVLQSGSSSPPTRWDCWSMAASFLHSILEASSSWVAC